MTIGTMVGGSGYDWGNLFTPAIPKRSKVIAGKDLPRGASVSFFLKEAQKISLLHEKFSVIAQDEESVKEIYSRGDELLMIGVSPPSWISWLPLAEDVHSEGARLSLTSGTLSPHGTLVSFTLTKSLKKGESLAFWFSSELASELGMPFLNFSHVRDGCYTCPNCTKTFGSPNPLKLHLAKACDALGSNMLWARLWNTFSSIHTPWETPRLLSRKRELNGEERSSYSLSSLRPIENEPSSFSLLGNILKHETNTKSISPDSTSVDHSENPDRKNSPLNGNQNHFQDSRNESKAAESRSPSFSAFKPVISNPQESHFLKDDIPNFLSRHNRKGIFANRHSALGLITPSISTNSSPLFSALTDIPLRSTSFHSSLFHWNHHSTHPASHPFLPPSLLSLAPTSSSVLNPLPSTSSGDPCADVESLVSSFGKNKGNHLCFYCGKAYSRKYGLKIHIRTHTGYKPLKCRVCLRPFGDPSNLNKHIRLHAQGDTPYRCEFCGKVLVRRRDLDRHLRSRHPNEILPEKECSPQSSSTTINTESPKPAPQTSQEENGNTIDFKLTTKARENTEIISSPSKEISQNDPSLTKYHQNHSNKK